MKRDFPFLPPGCSMRLDRVARDHVLQNLKDSLGSGIKGLVEELRSIGEPVALGQFLDRTGIELEDIYHRSNGSWTRIQREAGLQSPSTHLTVADSGTPVAEHREGEAPAEPKQSRVTEPQLLRGLSRILHIDEARRLRFLRDYFATPILPAPHALSELDRRMLTGFINTLITGRRSASDGIAILRDHPAILREIRELLDVLEDRAEHTTIPIQESPSLAGRYPSDIPLSLHARYTREEVFAAIGFDKVHREGPLWHQATNTDYFFVTLEKSERDYSPSTRYRDYAISPNQFHWESQSTIHEDTPTGQRYIHHESRGSHVMLLVRSTNKITGRSQPFTLLGPATYISHTGAKPMAILWRLHHPMPLDIFRLAKVAGG